MHWSNRFVFVVGLAVMAATSSFALLPARASGATYTILHSFADGSVTNDGQKPYAAPIQATDGNFYGTTATGGSAGKGTVYRITSTGLVTVLHSFGDGSVTDDGAYPEAELIQATDGNLYGTTSAGGAAGDGTVFEITTSGAITLLHSFGDTAVTNDGIYPEAPLIQASDGNFYSTTANGGSANDGSIFKITKSGVVTILHSFGDGSVTNDGTDPYGALIQATDGSFYSTTANGGSTGTTTPLSGCGTVFRMTAAGSVTILHSFRDGSVTNDGDGPYAGLIQASDGSFYGTTYYGGSTDTGKPSTGSGTVFRITTTGTLTIVHSFGDGSVVDDGANPLSPVIQGRDGSIYGTTNLGGSPTLNAGTVFKITPAGATTIVHAFSDGSVANDGVNSYCGLTMSSDGNLYGTSGLGGADLEGTVFEIILNTPRFDFNGDGKDDLLWSNSKTGQLAVWDMNGTVISPTNTGAIFTTINPIWQVKGVADINADGHPDLLWWDSHTGRMIFWEMTGAQGTKQLYTSPVEYTISNTQWQPVSMADFDGDGHPDILWENMTTGQLIVWYMNGMRQKSTTGVFATVPANWRVAGTGDFNQDGHPDLVLENSKTGAVAIWYMGGSGGTTILQKGATVYTITNTAWQIAGTGDMNGDGRPDLTWHNSVTGQTIVWLMGGALGTTQLKAGSPLSATPKIAWNIVGVR